MQAPEPWWPPDMGSPASSGAQNGLRYAFFRDKRRLIIEREGHSATYETGDFDINGISQVDAGSSSVELSSQNGAIKLSELQVVRCRAKRNPGT
jgi:hypothetical protein